jgi:hypothetical protein
LHHIVIVNRHGSDLPLPPFCLGALREARACDLMTR